MSTDAKLTLQFKCRVLPHRKLRAFRTLLLLLVGSLPTTGFSVIVEALPRAEKRFLNASPQTNNPFGAPSPASGPASSGNEAKDCRGPNTLGLVVVDQGTGDAIPKFTVHASFAMNSKPSNFTPVQRAREAARGRSNTAAKPPLTSGRLESQDVDDPNGICLYEELPAGNFEFQILADGYIPGRLTIEIPFSQETARIELVKGATVTGQIVEDANGRPFDAMEVMLWPSGDSETAHMTQQYPVKTDAEGRFIFRALPSDRYTIGFPDFPTSNLDWKSRGTTDPGRQRPAHFDRLAYLIPPRLELLDLTTTESSDLGTIRLKMVPIIDLEIVNESGAGLSSFPFDFALSPVPLPDMIDNTLRVLSMKTGDDGKKKFPLVGFQEKMAAMIFVPERMEFEYRVSLPDGTSEGDSDVFKEKLRGEVGKMKTEMIKRFLDHYNTRNQISAPQIGEQPGEPERVLEALPPEAKSKFDAGWKKVDAFVDKIFSRQEHPSAKAILPNPGEVCSVRIIYKSNANDLHLKLLARDKETKASIGNYFGLCTFARQEASSLLENPNPNIEEKGNDFEETRTFACEDGTGRAGIACMRLKAGMPFEEDPGKWLDDAAAQSAKDERKLFFALSAPGYVPQLFELSPEKARRAELLIFELGQAASARGRVVFAGTNDPLTTETMKAVLVSVGKLGAPGQADDAAAYTNLQANPSVYLNDAGLQWAPNESQNPHFAYQAAVQLDHEGRFNFEGLIPDEPWTMTMQVPPFQRFRRQEIHLHRGSNDLGIIRIGFGGKLEGYVIDDDKNPIAGAKFSFPLDPAAYNDREEAKLESDSRGGYAFDLSYLNFDKQIVRIDPPWGIAASKKQRSQVWFECLKTINRSAGEHFVPRIPFGNTLHVEVKKSPRIEELLKFYSKGENLFPYLRWRPKGDLRLAISQISILGLDRSDQGFVYQQKFNPKWRDSDFTSGTVAFDLVNVPPGRHALRVDAEAIGAQAAEGPEAPVQAIHLIYTEFEMPNAPYQLNVTPGGGDVEIKLISPPALSTEALKRGPVFIIQRLAPVSTGIVGSGALERQNTLRSSGIAPDYYEPFVCYSSGFEKIEKDSEDRRFSKTLFKSVPPGDYRVLVYSDLQEWRLNSVQPYFQSDFKVEDNTEKTTVEIPYQPQPPAPSFEPIVIWKTGT